MGYLVKIKAIAKNKSTRHIGIHKGLNTHHQLQSIVLVNLRIIKASSSKLVKPIPPLFAELFAIIDYFLVLDNFSVAASS